MSSNYTMSEFRFDNTDQYEVGLIFELRKALSVACIHGPPIQGIEGRQREVACSIVTSGLYADDIDKLDYIFYTGHDGPDDTSNMICLYPIHHAKFDAVSFYFDSGTPEIKGLVGFEGTTPNLSRKQINNSEFF